jgi:diguanylate cyclase (GGDEF)-like protein
METTKRVTNRGTAPSSIKRRGYFFGLGGAIIALLVAIPLERMSGQVSGIDTVALPITAICLLALLVAFIRTKSGYHTLELMTFGVLTSFFLVKLAYALYGSAGSLGVNDQLGEFAFWFPTLYASILFILGVDNGLRVAVSHYGLSLFVGLPYVVIQIAGGGSFPVVYALTQLYLSSAVAIATVVIFVRYTESLMRAKLEFEHLAHTDHVTRIGNRRQMERLLLQEVRRAERYCSELSVLLLDLDHFKRVNDLFGHPVGDEVLREISVLLLAESRAADHIGRWGGEEFIMILPKTSEQAGQRLAERIVVRVASQDFGRAGRVTLSAGGAAREAGEQPDELIKRADQALYQAKETGRNRVIMSGMESVAEDDDRPRQIDPVHKQA